MMPIKEISLWHMRLSNMVKRTLLALLLSFSVATLMGDSSVGLSLDLGEESYTFGLSSNPITSATPQPNDVQVKLEPVKETEGYRGVIGNIMGNTKGNELHFYWNVASPKSFSVYLGVDTSGDGNGALERTNWVEGQSAHFLNWTISLAKGSENISIDNYNNKLLLYSHDPTKGRNSYSSNEILIYTEPASYGIYSGTLVFTIQT